MKHLLIDEHWAKALRAQFRAHPIATQDERARFAAFEGATIRAARDDGPASLSKAGDTAQIRIGGVLTEEPDFWLWFFGYENTAYADVREAISAAESDPAIKKVIFDVDSPGGDVNGLFETIAAIQGIKKPTSVRARLACSAAYSIASVAGPIEAVSHASTFGSVGVVASYLIDDDVVDITSTEAPKKRPDVSTPEGQAVVREHLDEIHALFVEAIAAGRGTTVEKVNADYGRGGVMLAANAKRLGMIDKIAGARPGAAGARASADELPAPKTTAPPVAADDTKPAATEQSVAQESTHMSDKPLDLKTLKTQHSDTYDEAVAEGVTKERKRAKAHATMARKPGCLDIALKAIESGAAFADDDVQAEYMSARYDQHDVDNRQSDSDAAGKALDGKNKNAPAAGDSDSYLGAVADALEASKKG